MCGTPHPTPQEPLHSGRELRKAMVVEWREPEGAQDGGALRPLAGNPENQWEAPSIPGEDRLTFPDSGATSRAQIQRACADASARRVPLAASYRRMCPLP